MLSGESACRVDWVKLYVWLGVVLSCLFFWIGLSTVLTGSHGIKMPPARYDHVPKVKPVVVYSKVRQTNRQCRNKSTAAIGRGRDFYGCAMRIVGGPDKGRYLVYVATNAPVPANVILRHEYGHVNGWQH